jgi:glycosyltransferase involved in cell wall biosynthesis
MRMEGDYGRESGAGGARAPWRPSLAENLSLLRLRTLLPMACDGVGPSYICFRLVEGAWRAGAPADLFVNRRRIPAGPMPMHASMPGPLAALPHGWVQRPASWLLEQRYRRSIREGDIAYLWPAVSLETHRILHAAGVPIVLEGINTRMAAAKAVLDAAYDAFGAPPGHSITQARIDEEDEKYALATTIFAPSPGVERALAGTALADRFLPSSYGVDTTMAPPRASSEKRGTIEFLFCGYACIRKGVHHILDIWPKMPTTARLRLVGAIEPVVAERYRDLLGGERVETLGFVKGPWQAYAEADVFVFPSLEEGDALVTYEAALHGLPIVATPAGAGRIGAETGCALTVPPGDPEALLETLLALHDDPGHRAAAGAASREAVGRYDWNAVGARRARMLCDLPV